MGLGSNEKAWLTGIVGTDPSGDHSGTPQYESLKHKEKSWVKHLCQNLWIGQTIGRQTGNANCPQQNTDSTDGGKRWERLSKHPECLMKPESVLQGDMHA